VKRLLLAVIGAHACGDGAAPPPGSADANTGADVGADVDPTGSRCTSSGTTLTCTSHAVQLGGRTVTYEVPLGTPPAAGWPVVVFYQGSLVPGSRAFMASTSDSLGQYELTRTVQALLDGGYAVIAPNALGDGSQFWQTNVPPYATQWAGCDDDVFVKQLLDAMGGTMFGPLDATRRYAMGISSGGFMTSRMAVSYAGTFRALAIASASYATCSNTCNVPALPADHPPTLFVHGETDLLVPLSTMMPYRDALAAAGHDASAVVVAGAGHEWLADAVTAIPAWFDAH
jgi:poly(3-hydroxybutyrate) depolymerase